MKTDELAATARALVSPGKGIVAADESHATLARRFEPLGVANTRRIAAATVRCSSRPRGVEEYLSGVILFDKTIRQKADDGTLLAELHRARLNSAARYGRYSPDLERVIA